MVHDLPFFGMNRRSKLIFALRQVIRVGPLPVVVEAPQKEIHEPAWSHWRRDRYPAPPMLAQRQVALGMSLWAVASLASVVVDS